MNGVAHIEFTVRYRWAEYLPFVTEHAFETEPALQAASGIKRRVILACLTSFAAAAFLFKMARAGECAFAIDADRIVRRSRRGSGSVPWSQIKAVRTYSPGYLIELRHGAIPIPFRVLSQQQRELLCRFADASVR